MYRGALLHYIDSPLNFILCIIFSTIVHCILMNNDNCESIES